MSDFEASLVAPTILWPRFGFLETSSQSQMQVNSLRQALVPDMQKCDSRTDPACLHLQYTQQLDFTHIETFLRQAPGRFIIGCGSGQEPFSFEQELLLRQIGFNLLQCLQQGKPISGNRRILVCIGSIQLSFKRSPR